MFPSLPEGFVDLTDPSRLHAELWADSVSRIISCWLPILMSTVVVGRDLLGSSTQCFPLNIVQVAAKPLNGTSVSDGNSSDNAFSGTSEYSRQLAEFVNVYCLGQDSNLGNTMFSYQHLVMMLVIQAAVMYAPLLIWNITMGREIICNVRFIVYDTEVLYERFRKQNDQTGNQENVQEKVYGQEELDEADRKWRNRCTVYAWYIVKWALSFVSSLVFIVVYCTFQPISVHNIHNKFLCSVEGQFSVTCTVPTAAVHKFVWGANMALLVLGVAVALVHIVVLHASAKEQPFAEIGITNLNETRNEARDSSSSSSSFVTAPESFTEADITNSCLKRCPPLNDSQMMSAFFKANIESVEKYNYVKNLRTVAPEQPGAPGQQS